MSKFTILTVAVISSLVTVSASAREICLGTFFNYSDKNARLVTDSGKVIETLSPNTRFEFSPNEYRQCVEKGAGCTEESCTDGGKNEGEIRKIKLGDADDYEEKSSYSYQYPGKEKFAIEVNGADQILYDLSKTGQYNCFEGSSIHGTRVFLNITVTGSGGNLNDYKVEYSCDPPPH